MVTPWMLTREQWPAYDSTNLTKFFNIYSNDKLTNKEKVPKLVEKLVDFYINRNQPKDAGFKFFLERYVEFVSDYFNIVSQIWEAKLRQDSGWPIFFYFNEYFNPEQFVEDLPVKGTF